MSSLWRRVCRLKYQRWILWDDLYWSVCTSKLQTSEKFQIGKAQAKRKLCCCSQLCYEISFLWAWTSGSSRCGICLNLTRTWTGAQWNEPKPSLMQILAITHRWQKENSFLSWLKKTFLPSILRFFFRECPTHSTHCWALNNVWWRNKISDFFTNSKLVPGY